MKEKVIDLASSSDEADLVAAAPAADISYLRTTLASEEESEGGRESAEPSSLHLVRTLFEYLTALP